MQVQRFALHHACYLWMNTEASARHSQFITKRNLNEVNLRGYLSYLGFRESVWGIYISHEQYSLRGAEPFRVARLVKKFPAFYGTKFSLPCSQEPITGLYPGPEESSTHPISLRCVFSLLSLKRKVGLIRSPVCLSVCPSVCVFPRNNFWTN
jgi:hypothetical protein